MTNKILSTLLIACVLVSTAFAQDFPSYYPQEGSARTGRVDDVRLDENTVVIGDILYKLADSIVVHSMSAYSVSKARILSGRIVAFKLGSGREITEVWLLPSTYDPAKQRR